MKLPRLTRNKLKTILSILFFGAGMVVFGRLALQKLLLFVVESIALIGNSDLIDGADILSAFFFLFLYSFLTFFCMKGFKSSLDTLQEDKVNQ